ncbi:MAG: DUF2298 domain-containing protein, partial [Chloroflexota bacterium]
DVGRFNVRELPLYNSDHRNKISEISDELAEGDYLVLFSNRLYGTIPRLPERYPLSTEYYEKLFAGDLGYELQFTGHRPKSFLGIGYSHDPMARVDLPRPAGFEQSSGALLDVGFGWADESFTVYDHPRPMVFYNTGRLESSELLARVVDDARVPKTDREPGLMLTEEEAERQQANGTWSDIVVFGHGSSMVSWVVWLAAIEVMGLLALPLGMVLFRPLANRGYLLHKPLGLLLVAFGAWIMAATGVMEFSRWSVLVALGALAVVGMALGYGSRAGIREYLRGQGRGVLAMEALFLAAFAAFLLIRLANPDLWHPWRGGEKPMDFAYFNAVLKSTVMPPYDPWFAGGYLNYYYFGQFIVASVNKLTGIVPAIAYNLAIPTLFAMTVGGAFTIIHGMVARTRRGARGKSAAVAGLGAVVLVAVIGNLDAFAQVLSGAGRALVNSGPFGTFDFWRSSRLFPEASPGSEITEFPYFTFLFGDLHAHMIAIPFALLGVGLSISIFLRSASTPRGRLSVTLASLATLALTIGALRTTNAWDFPTALAIAAIAIFAGEALSGEGALKGRASRALVKFGFVAVLSHVLFLPFHSRYELFNDGLLLSEFQTPLWVYLSVHSIFLFSLAAYFLTVGWPWVRRSLSALFPEQSASGTSERQRDLLIAGALIVIGASAVVAGIVTTGYVTLALGGCWLSCWRRPGWRP